MRMGRQKMGVKMLHLFETDQKPKWMLLVVGCEPRILKAQEEQLKSCAQELQDRKIVVVAVSPDDVHVIHGNCRCVASAGDVAAAYGLSFDRFKSALIDEEGCVKWAAPEPVCYKDLIKLVDEMPIHDAEKATRGPASSF